MTLTDIMNFLHLETTKGTMIIKMFPEVAPQHVNQIRQLVKQKFYDGLTFHRVIDGFMIQGGCPKGDGSGGVSPTIPAEFNEKLHKRGICSMARSTDPDSASCQFFICLADTPQLDGQYTIWGEVVEGIEVLDNIKKGDPEKNGLVDDPDSIISLKFSATIPVDYKHK